MSIVISGFAFTIHITPLAWSSLWFLLQVKHFEKRRQFEKYKERIEKDGYEPIEEDSKR